MDRLTKKRADGAAVVAGDAVREVKGGYSGAAIERLAAYEDAVEVVSSQLASIDPRLEELKARGRIRSAEAQQLLAQKLTYSSMLHLMGIDDR